MLTKPKPLSGLSIDTKTLSFARVSGEVTHGDNLNFWIRAEDNCEKVYNTFTVYTYEKPGDINHLLNKNIPIKLNGAEISASVQDISPFLMGLSCSSKLRFISN